MRRAKAAILGICILVTGCGNISSADTAPPPSRTLIPRPLVERELGELLVAPEQVAAAMGVPAMTAIEAQTSMSDNSAIMAPPECLAIDGAAELQVYANSGYLAERDQSLNDGEGWKTYVKQSVVLFPYLEKAAEFFDASVEQWPSCHEYSHTQSGSQWSVGEIVTADRTLSTVATQRDAAAPGWGCGRALVQRNNVIVDVNTCSANPAGSALTIAQQVAANVDAHW
ncbi:putative lipoprotein LppH [Mycolicibacterium aurum]|uniref:Putative lipoprotein LppH n=1 Tax=Mycolicibacterium aurum TaxID=1791 RepID=A0A448IXJ7_MYCAU|nr:sensor domain-containing protein [Mycolicibacterium aurum]VEG57182.1 putative lipoprotein LppH [Mycolicibacterium aurum]